MPASVVDSTSPRATPASRCTPRSRGGADHFDVIDPTTPAYLLVLAEIEELTLTTTDGAGAVGRRIRAPRARLRWMPWPPLRSRVPSTASACTSSPARAGSARRPSPSALALALTRQGKRVLLVEVEGRQGISQTFDVPPLGIDEVRLVGHAGGGELWGLSVDAKAALLEYLQIVLQARPRRRRAGEDGRHRLRDDHRARACATCCSPARSTRRSGRTTGTPARPGPQGVGRRRPRRPAHGPRSPASSTSTSRSPTSPGWGRSTRRPSRSPGCCATARAWSTSSPCSRRCRCRRRRMPIGRAVGGRLRPRRGRRQPGARAARRRGPARPAARRAGPRRGPGARRPRRRGGARHGAAPWPGCSPRRTTTPSGSPSSAPSPTRSRPRACPRIDLPALASGIEDGGVAVLADELVEQGVR